MNCRRCGFANDGRSKFCNNCGAAFNALLLQQQKKKSDGWKLALGVLAGLCILSGIVNRCSPNSSQPPSSQNTTTPSSPPPVASQPSPSRPADVPPDRLRQELAGDYLTVISIANPHLNFIKQKTTKIKGGYALWLVHDYFTQSSFSIGDDGKLVSAWIDQNRRDLNKAGVVRVGLMNTSGYLGSCWFDLK